MKKIFKIYALITFYVLASCTKESVNNYETDISTVIVGTSGFNAKKATDITFYQTANNLNSALNYKIFATSSLGASIEVKVTATPDPSDFVPLTAAGINVFTFIPVDPADSEVFIQTSKYIRFNFRYNSATAGNDKVIVSLVQPDGATTISKIINIVVAP